MKFTPILSALLLGSLSLSAAAATFTVEKTPTGGAVVKIDGQFFTELVVDQANKPYLWPIIGPGGQTMTRAYPMKTVEGEQHDHPHHRGLCFGHENIGGYDTWAEAATFGESKNPKTAERVKHLGAIKHRELKDIKEGETASFTTVSDYVGPDGKKTIEEVRHHTFKVVGETRLIDIDIDLIATEGDTLVDDKKDSGLSIRVPTNMAVEKEKKTPGTGKIINSEGETDADAWAKRATWCDYYGEVDGKQVGVAMLNHPKSFRHPTPWHVRTYGLFTANPFGTQSLDPKAENGAVTLKKGEKITLRHRFIFHLGDEKAAKIAEAFADYAKEP
ncbi:methane monooxygenase PmoA-like [Prosthecobacter fusiformis]|uniref:Methane monooxygenase PmoA-like n=1 Tax=Prosthecobacter fusiformis TaxID=48464 RepID=A0A4R7RR20_9BACT|nr:PmoA family protein [Prosthecobacter fusiformis]TDU67235.1 methane monooxygenase PmoA-like [Prosthecobacter fusiformis]